MEDILREGSRGIQVRGAQQLLNERLLPARRLVVDGVFGPRTHDAVRRYQHSHGLLEDGEIGDDTWRSLSGTPQRGPSPKPAPPHPPASGAIRIPASPIVPHKIAQTRAPANRPPPLSRVGPLDTMIQAHPEAAWMPIAAAELGIHERSVIGTPRILQYHAATALRAHSDQVAWCASFVNWCLAKVNLRGTNSAAAASFAHWGIATEPRFGAIVQIHHAVAGHDHATGSSSGNHVAFLISKDATHLELLGGNQSDSVKVSRFPLARYAIAASRWPG